MVYSAIAQLVEQLTVNQLVAGSSPACGAILYSNKINNLIAFRKCHDTAFEYIYIKKVAHR